MTQPDKKPWQLLAHNLVVEELNNLNTDLAFLGINALAEPLRGHDVVAVVAVLKQLEEIEPDPMMSFRERVVLLAFAKARAAALRKIIEQVLAYDGATHAHL